MLSRAVHIDVSDTLTTDSFINAYRRFVGRRGPVRQVRSDQGTNYVGAMNELRQALSELNHDTIRDDKRDGKKRLRLGIVQNESSARQPYGWSVGAPDTNTVRNVLASLLEHHGGQLDGESLRTFMVEAEATVNCRPLTVNSMNSWQSLEPLTPNHLLTMKSKVVMPPLGDFQRADLYLRKRWRRAQHLANEFWSR